MRELPIFHKKPVRLINKLMEWTLVVTSAVIIVLVTYYVITRYFFKMNFPGFEEICILIIVWMYFVGSANASREQSHISAEMLELFVKDEQKRMLIGLIRRVIGLIVLVIMCWLSIDFLRFNAQLGASSTYYHIPMYLYHASLVLGLALMVFYDGCYLVDAVQTYRRVKKGGDSRPAGEEEQT